jgi:hypothetical protein
MLVCTVACEIMDVGAFKVGDIITTEKLVTLLKGHPYFESKEEN